MYAIGSSQINPRDTSVLNFSSNFKQPDGEIPKNKEFMSSDPHQQQQQQSSGLMRYRSAPSSFFANLVDGCDEFLNNQSSSSSESETMFAKFMSCNDDSDSHDIQFPEAIKHEEAESIPQPHNQFSICTNQMMEYQTSDFENRDSIRPMENLAQVKSNGGNCFGLIKQHSSPADFFSNLTVENGVAVMRDVGNFSAGISTNGEANPSTGRLSGHINFSSGQSSSSRFMPQIAENGKTSARTSSPGNRHLGNSNGSNGCYVPDFPNDSWNNSAKTSLKRNREGDLRTFSDLNAMETMNEDRRNYGTGLTHHLSLPKTSAEMASIEQYLQFQQDQVPMRTRAKRGHATHPRSIAERVRRTRISERMRKLQDLFPDMDKQANTADMLDLAVDYIKDLQKEVKSLNDTRAKCTCSSKQKRSNPTG